MVAVVVGASVAGVRTAQALLQLGYRDRIVLLGDESVMPYDRPPLSKAFLAGRANPDRITLLRDSDLADDRLELRLGERAVRVDTAAHELELATGERIAYDQIVVATGARARPAPWDATLPVVRTREDSERLGAMLRDGGELVVVGGGFIGAEVASTATGLGVPVTIVDPLEIPIARIVGTEMGAAIAGWHAANGAQAKLGIGIVDVTRERQGYELALGDGSTLRAATVVVGIGAMPNDEWLAASGLPVENGVLCDAYCRIEGHPDAWAAGDVARWMHPRHQERVRTEHWTNAVEQGQCVAYNLLNPDEPQEYAPIEYVWTDQYGRKVQIAGRPSGGRPVAIGEQVGSPKSGCLFADEHDRLVGAVVLDWPRALMAARAVLSEGGSIGALHDRLAKLSPGAATAAR